MATTEKLNSTEKDTLQLVLEEYTQEQAGNTKAVNDLITAVNGLSDKFRELEEKVERPREINVSTDTQPIQDIMRKGITDMKLTVSIQPRPIVKKFQLLLFPEQDAKLFYRVVFGRWFLFLVIMLFITDLYNWGVHWSDNQEMVQNEQLENDRIREAWYNLYNQQGKAGKRLMDSAFAKSRPGENE